MHIYLALLAAMVGLGISSYIYKKKHTKTKLICPRNANCDAVVSSRFGTTFGIPNEVLGMFYYAIVGLMYAVLLFTPSLLTPGFHLILVIATALGALFSLYFIGVQAFILRTWCLWCLGSALASAALVSVLFFFPGDALFKLLSEQKVWWVIIHNLGFILGLGGATITDISFFRFLKDHQISENEKETMDMLSSVIWTGLAILVVSGIMLYLPEQGRLDASSKFLVKVVVVGVVIVNGFFMNLLVAPKLRQLSFERTPPATHFRRIAFALGGISIVSWYLAFLLGSFRSIILSFSEGMLGYGVILLCVVIGSQIYERFATRKTEIKP